ncbi:MAG TPA: thiamine-phosphate kinase [Pyrinomonadaceae bacterium]|nr:thiamine-phosphate kinase [Pyrinomonadaceae bacterium]
MKEFDFINQIRRQFDLKKIGDDCAVLPKNETHDMLNTSDLIVEDIDFRRSWMIPEFLGHKALAVSLSDIAAMGGKPLYSMLSIGIPEDIWKTDFVDEFYEGYFKLAQTFEVELIGGDISKTPDKIVIDSTVIGEVEKNKAILRSGAKIGDLIFVTGVLGGASAGLKLLEDNISGFDNLKLRQLKPYPKVEEGLILSKFATSMIDISDGLSSDLMHVCQLSQVGARIYADKIPFPISEFCNLESALNDGEDFELLFTVSPKNIFDKKLDSFFCIGEVTANVGIIELIRDEKSTVLQPKGYQHF